MVHGAERTLVGHGEPSDLLHRVAPQLHPDGMLRGRREHVDDAAPDSELPTALHQVAALIPESHEFLGQPTQFEVAARTQFHRGGCERFGGDRLHRGPHRRHDDVERFRAGDAGIRTGQPADYRQSLSHDVGGR